MVGRIPASYHREASPLMAKAKSKKPATLTLKEKREQKRTKDESIVRPRKGA